MTAVAVEDLSKRFRLTAGRATSIKERALRGRQRYDEFWALRNVSFELQEGKTLGLLGHNGSGKSTLLKCIAGILKPTEGQALTKGRIASLLELGAGFHPELTGRENVFVNASFLGIASKEIERRFDDIVEFAELEQFIDQQVKYYSSGMFVRLGFSVAVNVDPDILLVDEVLAVGDENFQRKCLEKVRAFQREGRTILVVSHAADLMRQVADKVAVLDHGHLVAFDDPGPAIRVFREHLLEGQLERKAIEAERRRSVSAAAVSDPGDGESPPEPMVDVPPSLAHGAAQEAKRTLQIRFTSVTIEHDHAAERKYLLPGEPVRVRVGYEVKEPTDDVAFGIGVFDNEDGRPLFGVNTDMLGLDIGWLEGTGEIVFDFDAVPLLDGTYPITLGIHSHDEGTVYDWSEQRHYIEVMNPGRSSGKVAFPVRVEMRTRDRGMPQVAIRR